MVGEKKPADGETSDNNQDNSSGNNQKIDDQVGSEAGNESGQSSGEHSAEHSEGQEQSSGQQQDKFQVGDKVYSKEQAMDILSKSERFQGDRDRAEQALSNFVGQVKGLGYNVDDGFNITQQSAQGPTEQELAEAAAAGDVTAFNALREKDRNTVKSELAQQYNEAQTQQEMISSVKRNYPEFYKRDAQENILRDTNGRELIDFDSPLTKEAQSIVGKEPLLSNPKFAGVVAKLAQANLNEKNFSKVEGGIRRNAQQRFQASASNAAAGSSGGSSDDLPGLLTDEQMVVTKAFGQDPARIGRIIQKAQANKGRFVIE